MTNNNEPGQMPAVIELPPVNMSLIHPHAVQRYTRFHKELCDEVLIEQLRNEDFTAQELADFEGYMHGIAEWLNKCRGEAGGGALPYSSGVSINMDNVTKLLKVVYARKLEKARQEAAEKELKICLEAERRRREAALKKMAAPVHDAEKYLNDEEQQQFVTSTAGAVNAFVAMPAEAKAYDPEMWRLSPEARDYLFWTAIISQRKNEEARRAKAKREYEHYVKELGDSIKKIKEELGKEKKQSLTCPTIFTKYPPNLWCDLVLPDEEEIRSWARPLVLARIPKVLVPVISMVITPRLKVIPRAEYRFLGCPSLTWIFDICVAAQAELYLKTSTITKIFHGWEYSIPVAATKLGTMHLKYCLWESEEAVSTPLALLRLILNKDAEGPGIKVLTHNFERTEYVVDGYDEDVVELRKGFIDFIRSSGSDQPLAHALLEKGVIDQGTAELMEAKWDEPLPEKTKTAVCGGPGAGNKEGTGDDLVASLEAMGLKKAEITAGIEAATLTPGMTLEEKVKAVLKNTGM